MKKIARIALVLAMVFMASGCAVMAEMDERMGEREQAISRNTDGGNVDDRPTTTHSFRATPKPNPTQRMNNDMTTYKSQEGAYRVQYPREWTLDSSGEADNSVTFYIAEESNNTNALIRITHMDYTGVVYEDQFFSIAQDLKDSLSDTFDDVKMEGQGEFTDLGGRRVFQMIYSFAYDGLRMNSRQYVFFIGTHGYTIMLCTSTEHQYDYLEEVDALVKSMEFTDVPVA